MSDSYSRGERMGAGRYWAAVRDHWVLISLFVAVAVVTTAFYSLSVPKRFKAEADIVVTPIPANDTTFIGINSLLRDSTQGQVVLTAARLASAREVGEKVKTRLHLAARPAVEIEPLGQSNVVAVVATANSASRAAQIANAYADAVVSLRATDLQHEVSATIRRLEGRLKSLASEGNTASNKAIATQIRQRLADLTPLLGARNPTLSILSRAVEPSSASWPRPKLSIAVAFVCALLLGSGLALAVDLLNPVIKNENELLFEYRLPILARLPRVAQSELRAFLSGRDELPSDLREAYRMLRGGLQRAGPKDQFPRVIVVSSASREEGKTVTSISLAEAVARSGARVVLVDGDLRNPMLGAVFGVVRGRDGLPDLLRGNTTPAAALVDGSSPNLRLLLSAPAPDVLDQLQQEHVASVLAQLRKHADVVVIDSAPLTEVADSYAFANAADAVILCVRLGRTSRDRMTDMLRRLAQLRIAPAGFVVISRRRTFAPEPYGQREPTTADLKSIRVARSSWPAGGHAEMASALGREPAEPPVGEPQPVDGETTPGEAGADDRDAVPRRREAGRGP